MDPDAAENLTNAQSPEKACIEKPAQLCGHLPDETYQNKPSPQTHHEISRAMAAPTTPKSNSYTKTQLVTA